MTHQRYIDIRAAVTEWCTWVQAKEPTLKLQVVRVTESLSAVENPTEFMRIWRKCVMKLQNKSWIALILWEINNWSIISITYSNSWTRRASAMQLRYLTSLLSARNAIVKVTALAWSPSRLALFERKLSSLKSICYQFFQFHAILELSVRWKKHSTRTLSLYIQRMRFKKNHKIVH